jgi:copper chaperone CopZ
VINDLQMTLTYSISGMTCSGCANTVKKSLAATPNVNDVQIDLVQGTASITMSQHIPFVKLQEALGAYPSYKISEEINPVKSANLVNPAPSMWTDINIWGRASLNTLNCLIGCSIGDFAMVIFLQAYYPTVSMTAQMILATIAGLITSILLETILLHWRENFSWGFAFRTALSMSLLSMIAMELAMNTTDFMITGGKAAFGNPMYWTALVIAIVAGFLIPLPYNYYKLKKFNKACH